MKMLNLLLLENAPQTISFAVRAQFFRKMIQDDQAKR